MKYNINKIEDRYNVYHYNIKNDYYNKILDMINDDTLRYVLYTGLNTNISMRMFRDFYNRYSIEYNRKDFKKWINSLNQYVIIKNKIYEDAYD